MGNLCKTICEDCQKVFMGGPNAYLCPVCRKKRLIRYAKERRLNELGNSAYSEQQKRRTNNG